MPRVLVTEEIADNGLQALRAAGHEVDVQLGLNGEALQAALPGAAALIVRSATKVTDAVLAAGTDLIAVGRAGIGLDNVDVLAATTQGVMVINAPQSNIISAAEHAIALLMAQARNVPQANEALRAGRWERAEWEGVELYGKTLAIVGLGRIGALVAQRMAGFGMHLVAYDPYISADRARQLGCELLPLDQALAAADFVTVHLPKTPETLGLLGKEMLALAKPGVRIVNAARGGIVDEEALAEAIRSGHVQGAALDVFATEPQTESPLFDLPSVIVTPHLGASTAEAQDKAGVTIAEQLLLALAGDFVPYAVNVDAAEAGEAVRPFLALAKTLGRMYAALTESRATALEVAYQGTIAEQDTRILTLAVLEGFFTGTTEGPVSYVNAPQIAAERGIEVTEARGTESRKHVSLVTVRGAEHSVGGTLAGADQHPRVVMVDGFEFELRPAQNMLVVRNDDRPGMVGSVGMALADAGINIADMSLGRSADRTNALMVIATDQPVPEATQRSLAQVPGMLAVETLAR